MSEVHRVPKPAAFSLGGETPLTTQGTERSDADEHFQHFSRYYYLEAIAYNLERSMIMPFMESRHLVNNVVDRSLGRLLQLQGIWLLAINECIIPLLIKYELLSTHFIPEARLTRWCSSGDEQDLTGSGSSGIVNKGIALPFRISKSVLESPERI